MAWVKVESKRRGDPVRNLMEHIGPDAEPSGVRTATSENAAATPERSRVVLAYAVVAAMAVAVLIGYVPPASTPALRGDALLAVGLFLAQGLERLLEPLSHWAGRTHQLADGNKNELARRRDDAMATAVRAADAGSYDIDHFVRKAADAQASLDQFRANLTVTLWAAGCVAGTALAWWADLRLLHAVGASVAGGWDVIVSGIAIGSATKPLHDLVGALQSSRRRTDGGPAGS